MPMGLKDGVLLSIEICSIGQWGKILVMVMGFVGTFEQGRYLCGPKMSTFCQRLYHNKCQLWGIGGQKSQNLVNVVCEWPLMLRFILK